MIPTLAIAQKKECLARKRYPIGKGFTFVPFIYFTIGLGSEAWERISVQYFRKE
jgi:hypothetical protein